MIDTRVRSSFASDKPLPNESHPDSFQPCGGFPGSVHVEGSHIVVLELPGPSLRGQVRFDQGDAEVGGAARTLAIRAFDSKRLRWFAALMAFPHPDISGFQIPREANRVEQRAGITIGRQFRFIGCQQVRFTGQS